MLIKKTGFSFLPKTFTNTGHSFPTCAVSKQISSQKRNKISAKLKKSTLLLFYILQAGSSLFLFSFIYLFFFVSFRFVSFCFVFVYFCLVLCSVFFFFNLKQFCPSEPKNSLHFSNIQSSLCHKLVGYLASNDS